MFSVLPTGYGKTTVYGLLTHVYKELGESNAVVLVISPLISLMKDQVTNIEKLKVKPVYIGDTSTEGYFFHFLMFFQVIYFQQKSSARLSLSSPEPPEPKTHR